MGRGKKRERGLASLFPLPIVPHSLSVSLSPVLPTIQRGLCGGERPCHDTIDNDLANDYLLFTVRWFTADNFCPPRFLYVTVGRSGSSKIKVRRYQFIVFFNFTILIRQWSKSPTKCEFQLLLIFFTHLWMTPFWCKNCNPAMISAV